MRKVRYNEVTGVIQQWAGTAWSNIVLGVTNVASIAASIVTGELVNSNIPVLTLAKMAAATAYATATGTTAITATTAAKIICVLAAGTAQTVNIPSGTSVGAGAILIVYKSGGAGAATLTPAAGTIAGSATHIAVDATGDWAIFMSDGTNWILGPNVISG